MPSPPPDEPFPGMPAPDAPVAEVPYDELGSLAMELRCEHCKAAPGEWCRTRSGHGAANLHAARWLVCQSIFWLGFEHGRQHAIAVA